MNRPFQIKSHVYMSNYEEDKVIFEENDPQNYIETNPTKDNKYIVVNSHSKTDSMISLISLKDQDFKPVEVFRREKGIKYFVEHCEVRVTDYL
jgi:protease II